MNKLFFKNVLSVLATGFLAFCGLLLGATQASAEIPAKYFAADLEASDLLQISSKYPVLFWTALIILIVLCVGYGIYRFAKKK